MLIIPMLAAIVVRIVLTFFVKRFLKLEFIACASDIDVFAHLYSLPEFLTELAAVSSITTPSDKRTIRSLYFSAISALWVTIITSLSLLISLIKSIICALVLLSSAPVGSSARIILGSVTKARAIATLCI